MKEVQISEELSDTERVSKNLGYHSRIITKKFTFLFTYLSLFSSS